MELPHYWALFEDDRVVSTGKSSNYLIEELQSIKERSPDLSFRFSSIPFNKERDLAGLIFGLTWEKTVGRIIYER